MSTPEIIQGANAQNTGTQPAGTQDTHTNPASNHSAFTVTQLSHGVWCINEDLVSCFLIAGSQKALLFDSCLSNGEALRDVVDTLTDKPVELALSHADPDHTGARDYFGAPFLHPAEYEHFQSKHEGDYELRPIWEGEVFDLGERKLEVVLVPGHTPGSIALLDREERQLFVGDSVSDYWIYMFGAGRSLDAFIESMKKLEQLSGAYDLVYACHGTAQLGAEWVSKAKAAAEKLRAGELKGEKLPRDLPCLAYIHEGVTLLY